MCLKIFIFGAGFPKGIECLECCEGCQIYECEKPKKRKIIKNEIETQLGDLCIFPEELQMIHPSVEERIYIREAEIDLIIILPESPGSIYEFADFSREPEIAPKLRIFVPNQYYPLSSQGEGLLADAYLLHLTIYGHVYSYQTTDELIFRVLKLVESYRYVKKMNT